MKLIKINQEPHVATVKIYKRKDNFIGSHFRFINEFIRKIKLTNINIYFDEEDPEKKYMYVEPLSSEQGISLAKTSKGASMIRSTKICKTILNGAAEAKLYMHQKITSNGKPMLVLRVEREK